MINAQIIKAVREVRKPDLNVVNEVARPCIPSLWPRQGVCRRGLLPHKVLFGIGVTVHKIQKGSRIGALFVLEEDDTGGCVGIQHVLDPGMGASGAFGPIQDRESLRKAPSSSKVTSLICRFRPVIRSVLRSWWQTRTPSLVAETETSIALAPF